MVDSCADILFFPETEVISASALSLPEAENSNVNSEKSEAEKDLENFIKELKDKQILVTL